MANLTKSWQIIPYIYLQIEPKIWQIKLEKRLSNPRIWQIIPVVDSLKTIDIFCQNLGYSSIFWVVTCDVTTVFLKCPLPSYHVYYDKLIAVLAWWLISIIFHLCRARSTWHIVEGKRFGKLNFVADHEDLLTFGMNFPNFRLQLSQSKYIFIVMFL